MNNFHHAISRVVLAGTTRYLREHGLSPALFGPYEPIVQEILEYEAKYGNTPPWDHLLRKFEDTELASLLEPEPKLGPDEDGPLADAIRAGYIQSKAAILWKDFMDRGFRHEDPQQLLDSYINGLGSLRAETLKLSQSAMNSEKLFAYFRELGLQTFIPTGFKYLDDQFGGGIAPTDYVIVLARPRVGKSFTMIRMALTAALAGRLVLYFTLETPKEDTLLRFVAELDPAVDYSQLVKGRGDTEKVKVAMEELDRLPLVIVDARDMGNPTPAAVQTLVEKVEPALVFVDQMSFMRDDEKAREIRLRFINVSNAFARMTKKLRVPVVVASQAKREAEGRMPEPQDAAESDAMFQDSDKFFAMHKDDAGLHMQVYKSKNSITGGAGLFAPDEHGGLWRWRQVDNMDEF